MNIYKSNFLSIRKEDETLIQTWTDNKLDATDYQQELYNFMDLFYKIRPKKLLWDTKRCTLAIPAELDNWMGEKILIPIYKKGIRELIFTIPEDIAVHLSIVASLEKASEIIRPIYFLDFNEATLYPLHNSTASINTPTFNCRLNTELNSFDVNLNVTPNDLPRLLHSINQIEIENQFLTQNKDRYNSLTMREIQIFKFIVVGKTNRQIGLELFIEESSVKTHRKRIKEKLNIKSNYDLYQYARCFHII
jgi:DNA-binding CsgD family transcriptional regulator